MIEINNTDGKLDAVFNDQFSTLGAEASYPDDWIEKLASLKIEDRKDEYYLSCCEGTFKRFDKETLVN